VKQSVYKERLLETLSPIHKQWTNITYTKVVKKLRSLRTSLRKRSLDGDIEFNITMPELTEKLLNAYGKKCKYCSTILKYNTMVMDHIVPIKKGGPSISSNLHFICKRCNTIKGPLDETDFIILLKVVDTLSDELKAYIMRKLSKGGRY